MLRFLDAGESHGRAIITILEGLPSGVQITPEAIEKELGRRRLGYGRSPRMNIETDRVHIISGVRMGASLGSPIAMKVDNAEYEKWEETMSVEGRQEAAPLTQLRPGHADLAGAIKYRTRDVRNILERASARETVGRVMVGTIAKNLLRHFDIEIHSHVLAIGKIKARIESKDLNSELLKKADQNPMRCLDFAASKAMTEAIDEAIEKGNSLGGTFEVIAFGMPIGLGSHVQWDRRLDGRIAAGIMSLQAIKGVEIGDGFGLAAMGGFDAADNIYHEEGKGFQHSTNHSGGIEGGISNGEPIVVRAAMKPIPTLASPLDSVDLVTRRKIKAAVERADVCAVPAAAVIAESILAFILADALLEKLGGDNIEEMEERFERLKAFQADF
jgi:chorismate synthase